MPEKGHVLFFEQIDDFIFIKVAITVPLQVIMLLAISTCRKFVSQLRHTFSCISWLQIYLFKARHYLLAWPRKGFGNEVSNNRTAEIMFWLAKIPMDLSTTFILY